MKMQPGPQFWALIKAGLESQDAGVTAWCRARGLDHNHVRRVCKGQRNGRQARALRAQIAKSAGLQGLLAGLQGSDGNQGREGAQCDDDPRQLGLFVVTDGEAA